MNAQQHELMCPYMHINLFTKTNLVSGTKIKKQINKTRNLQGKMVFVNFTEFSKATLDEIYRIKRLVILLNVTFYVGGHPFMTSTKVGSFNSPLST